jgi:hypothetical protein
VCSPAEAEPSRTLHGLTIIGYSIATTRASILERLFARVRTCSRQRRYWRGVKWRENSSAADHSSIGGVNKLTRVALHFSRYLYRRNDQ